MQPARREYLGALAMLVAGGALGLAASSQTWGTAEVPSALTPEVVDVSGNDLVPLASGVSLVALAAVVAVPATRKIGRRLVGGALLLAGAGLTIVALVPAQALDDRVRDWAASDSSLEDPTATIRPDILSTSPQWPFALMLAGLLVWGAGVLVAVRGPSWPALSSRYDRPDRSGRSGDGAPARDTWDALDRGDDPTT